MSDLIHIPCGPAALPVPRVPVSVRGATLADLPFIDGLQKRHTKQVGWMPTKQLEGKVRAGRVIVAWADSACSAFEGKDMGGTPMPRAEPVGYLIGADQYFKRDDVGIIYQLNVLPGMRRGFIGATLLKAQFERSAYGCKLYCCWCAQDIEANRFWEAMGFAPLAFRAGSEKRSRVHIFWQRRIRAGDTTTPWWFPSQTAGGSIREDRIVLPIPPGTHWSDVMPILLPTAGVLPEMQANGPRRAALADERSPHASRKPAAAKAAKPAKRAAKVLQGFAFAPPVDAAVKPEKPKAQPRPKVKNDPKLVAAARELRDRWLEQVNAHPAALPAVAARGKYEVSRTLADLPMTPIADRAVPALPSPIAA